MDFASRQIEVELENEEFEVDTDVVLPKQFMKNGVYYAEASFICNLEDEGFDANLILDREDLLSTVAAEDVQSIISISPYFTVEVEKNGRCVGIDILVRKTLVRKNLDYSGRLTAFVDETEILVKSNRSDLKINLRLLVTAECFEQQPLKMDKQFAHKIVQEISGNTAGLIRKEEEEYEISEQLRRLLEMAKAYKNLFSKVEEKCDACNFVIRQRNYHDYNTGDKRDFSRIKLCFTCSGKKILKRSIDEAHLY